MNSSNIVIGIVVVAVLAVGSWFVFANQAPAEDAMMEKEEDAMMEEKEGDAMIEVNASAEGEVMMEKDDAMMESN